MNLDFFIMGTEKGGSTYLLQCVREHPAIFMPRQEVAFFEDPFYVEDDLSEFEKHFSDAGEGQLLGVKRPTMLGHPRFGERLQRHYPDAKLIAILRNPIDRALSAHTHHRAAGIIPNMSAERFLNRILEGPIPGSPRASTVLEQGLYERHLRRLEQSYPTERICLLTLDDIKKDDRSALRKVFTFLDVDPDYVPESRGSRPMRAPYSPIVATYRRFMNSLLSTRTEDGFLVGRTNPLLAPVHFVFAAGYRVLEKVVPPGSKPTLSPELRARLVDYYAEDISGLEQRLGRDLSSWRR